MSWLEAIFAILINPLFYKLTLLSATPLIFASLGGVYSESTGVTNIALEGIMLMGAFTSITVTYVIQQAFGVTLPWIGVLAAAIVGLGFAWLHAWASIRWAANQIVSATALIIIAQGLTSFLMKPIFGHEGRTDPVAKISEFSIPFFKKGTFLGEIFGELSPFVYIALLSVFVSWFIMYRTPLGLRMRAVGENPEAADTLGINVYGIRYFGVLMSGLFASLGGAFLSIGDVGSFGENMVRGRGFIALAAMILGNWNPLGALGASLLFGAAEAMNLQLQSSSIVSVSATVKPLFNMIPFVVTLIVVGGFIGKTRPPAADGIPYEKGS
ncbi:MULTISPECIES: ABC transporter permease [Kosmotoga]|jgi:simple sugar transport system permease protein|uniref:Inner-membrane translocator n=1 Tax=Kosmotoga olearia (strain ATCC BAA-1733 / DSM 21960 / TBF 19.5.1) TaxID=521045 RepID=C5CER1_KOSOT|nr:MULTISPECIES: ABC transporter permease [Kosmotoga]ACR80241.1 inner-membrane translocator [Kosmotoga olearia TBF 19.5.1]MDI3523474.1 ral nucleoside transport system permease protein [Kosmotoga sp.]MDK2952983.1 ral nucleoside transport system permease protein [Kosmotoga sp.]OAA20181.1 branched-chain amino acid ABC transporter permease [Kosmotoga sp. DU53]